MNFKKITVFGGASKTIASKYNDKAFKLGQLIAQNGSTLVFGIGDNGMLGQVFHGLLKDAVPYVVLQRKNCWNCNAKTKRCFVKVKSKSFRTFPYANL